MDNFTLDWQWIGHSKYSSMNTANNCFYIQLLYANLLNHSQYSNDPFLLIVTIDNARSGMSLQFFINLAFT